MTSRSYRLFNVVNIAFLSFLAILCIIPMVHVIAVSFSSASATAAGRVALWPVEFNFQSYIYVANKKEFWDAFGVSLQRLLLGTLLNMVLTVMVAFPLSKESEHFRSRTVYVWFFVVTILFSGGLIPLYMTVRSLGLLDSLWALILPGVVPVFNIILLLNFFRALPRELEEAAWMDGAGHVRTLVRIYLPLSLPALATLTLFAMVAHWNAWFDGLIFMNLPQNYPLQSYLQSMVIRTDFNRVITEADLERLRFVSDRTLRAAQIFLGAIPILVAYPFLQRFFIKGIVLGSIKQ